MIVLSKLLVTFGHDNNIVGCYYTLLQTINDLNILSILKPGFKIYVFYAIGSLCYKYLTLSFFMNDAISDMRRERDSLFVITRYFDWLQGLVQDLSQILGLLSRYYYEYRNASKCLKITLDTVPRQILLSYWQHMIENWWKISPRKNVLRCLTSIFHFADFSSS